MQNVAYVALKETYEYAVTCHTAYVYVWLGIANIVAEIDRRLVSNCFHSIQQVQLLIAS